MSKMSVNLISFTKNIRSVSFQNQKNPGILWDEKSWFYLKVKVIGT